MQTVGGWMIQQDHSADVASVAIDGAEGGIYAVSVKGWNCDVAFYLKMEGEKQILLTKLPNDYKMTNVRDLLEEYVDFDFVENWNPIFLLEPHAECVG